MRLLVDTNIVLDLLLEREGLVDDALDAIKTAISNGDKLYLSSSAVTDIYYVIRKIKNSKEDALKGIARIVKVLHLAEVNEKCILAAMDSKMDDFEDAVVDAVAGNIKADYIITRNIKHFKNSQVKALTPIEFLKR